MIGAAVTIYSHSQSLSSFTVKKGNLLQPPPMFSSSYCIMHK
uniref:Uncharacterized protein n=1 Tax=Anguilla anguilla TaxID=7936 RepID=A0A0E9UQP8_ANGAN